MATDKPKTMSKGKLGDFEFGIDLMPIVISIRDGRFGVDFGDGVHVMRLGDDDTEVLIKALVGLDAGRKRYGNG